jgi:hypothetical protein
MSLDEDHKDRLERMKILYDLTKHVTTLSMGTLLLMAGWFDKVFKNPVWKPVAAGSISAFRVLYCFFGVRNVWVFNVFEVNI